MYFEAFDPELLRVHGDAYARNLRETMAAGRRGTILAPARRWVGGRLVDLGAALAADPAMRAGARAAHAGQQGC
jgi:hypothetical protein